jgi:hypothetical protein
MMEPTTAPAEDQVRAPLVLPFAALGLAGGLLAVFRLFGAEAPSAMILLPVTVSVTSCSAGVGAVARRLVGLRSRFRAALALAGTIGVAGAVAGGLAGATVGALAGGEMALGGFAIGALMGAWCSTAFLLPMGVVFFAARWARSARVGTTTARSAREAVWALVCCSVALASAAVAATAAPDSQRLVAGVVLGLVAVCGLGFVAAGDFRRLSALRALSTRVRRMAEPGEALGDMETDLGVGEEHWLTEPPGAPYRSGKPAPCVRGALFEVHRRLSRAAHVRAFEIVSSVVLLGLALRPADPSSRACAAATVAVEPEPPHLITGRGLAWYPLSEPILADLNGDGREDIVGLRWNSAHEEAALVVAANDGATLAPLWQSDPLPCQWANPRTRLRSSGDRLFLTDSEGLLRVYEAKTGALLSSTETPAGTQLACSDEGSSEPRAWLARYPAEHGAPAGFLVDATGALTPANEPPWCNRWMGKHGPCAGAGRGVCRGYHYGDRAVASHFAESYALEEGGTGVALGSRDDLGARADELVGYDPASRKVRWREPVARDHAPHSMPRVELELFGGQAFTLYQTQGGPWELAARDATTGAPTWSTFPPRAVEGTNFESLTVTGQGIYLGLSNRLEVFDPATGASRGVIW